MIGVEFVRFYAFDKCIVLCEVGCFEIVCFCGEILCDDVWIVGDECFVFGENMSDLVVLIEEYAEEGVNDKVLCVLEVFRGWEIGEFDYGNGVECVYYFVKFY